MYRDDKIYYFLKLFWTFIYIIFCSYFLLIEHTGKIRSFNFETFYIGLFIQRTFVAENPSGLSNDVSLSFDLIFKASEKRLFVTRRATMTVATVGVNSSLVCRLSGQI